MSTTPAAVTLKDLPGALENFSNYFFSVFWYQQSRIDIRQA
jgi:hypothetical protein